MDADSAEQLEMRTATARAWFEHLRDDICAGLETLEAELLNLARELGAQRSIERRSVAVEPDEDPFFPECGRDRDQAGDRGMQCRLAELPQGEIRQYLGVAADDVR